MNDKLIQDIVQWDVRSWSKALLFWDDVLSRDAGGGRCLELGAREGGLSLWLALKGMEVVCSDIDGAELRASPLHKKYDVVSRIRYLEIDATDIPFQDHFDIVVFKSVLGAVGYGDRRDRQQRAIDQIFKALKPGGKLLFAENLKSTPLHGWLRRHVVRGYAADWRYVTLQEMRTFLKQFSLCRMHTTGLIALAGRTETQRRLLALLDGSMFDLLVPETWRYIVYGVATK